MAKPKKNSPKPEAETQTESPASATAKTPIQPRVTFPQTPDGKPDVEHMSEGTILRARTFFLDASMQTAMGLQAQPDDLRAFSDRDVADAIGMLELSLSMAARWSGMPAQLSKAIFTLTEEEKGKIIPPATAIANKRLGAKAAQLKDEGKLALGLIAIVAQRYILMRQLAAAATRPEAAQGQSSDSQPNGEKIQ